MLGDHRSWIIPLVPPDKDFHVFLVDSDASIRDIDFVDRLVQRLETFGYKCVSKRHYEPGMPEIGNFDRFVVKSWKYVLVLSRDFFELVNTLNHEYSVIVKESSNERSNIVRLMLDNRRVPPSLDIFPGVNVPNTAGHIGGQWFKDFLKSLGATEVNTKESSFRHCSMCRTTFRQDFRQYQCSQCKEVTCRNCCKYMMKTRGKIQQVCVQCFKDDTGMHQNVTDNSTWPGDNVDVTIHRDAMDFGFIVYVQIGYGGGYKLMKSTRSSFNYCDICKRNSPNHSPITLAQCAICYEIGCRGCINLYAPLTRRQIAMGSSCYKCFQKRHDAHLSYTSQAGIGAQIDIRAA